MSKLKCKLSVTLSDSEFKFYRFFSETKHRSIENQNNRLLLTQFNLSQALHCIYENGDMVQLLFQHNLFDFWALQHNGMRRNESTNIPTSAIGRRYKNYTTYQGNMQQYMYTNGESIDLPFIGELEILSSMKWIPNIKN